MWKKLQEQIFFDRTADSIPQWVGFLSYDINGFEDYFFDGSFEKEKFPAALFYKSSCVIRLSHHDHHAQIFISEEGRQKLPEFQQRWLTKILDPSFWKEENFEKEKPSSFSKAKLIFSSDDLESYCQKIKQAQEWILDGEIYQVNLSQKFIFKSQQDSFGLFQELNKKNPAPFSAFLQCGTFSIVSSSPERFLQKVGNRLETRPIKGTARRGNNVKEDKICRDYLLNSEKERAELLMIVDLMRNDLGKVSLPCSVKVLDLVRCETYTNVFHLLAIIESIVNPEKTHPIDILKACFPGGSITGCPKLTAMKAIFALEKRMRGVYTGSIGYFTQNGDFDFNIAIRTLVIKKDEIEVQLGGAITYDSNPEQEYMETLHKGKTLFNVLGFCSR